MSRKTYPTQLRDHLGNEVRLSDRPFATGGEGPVYDVVGHPDLVAKLYHTPPTQDRCDKLHAMTRMCNQDLLTIAAWPTATLSRNQGGVVEGFLMPRITGYKEIHHLYSVGERKKSFPEADWGFLLTTARNCAAAFEKVHNHGHVIGDVNQKNLMVSKKGFVAIVDCDSFQVREGSRIFRCSVGVPEYTPPELHGRKFAEIDRNVNHDHFGLAVIIFHLLMLGRHPFSGVPQVNADIPIEKAIKGGFYAYSRMTTQLKPPPHVPPITILDQRIQDLFETAFMARTRPSASDWRGVLDSCLKKLEYCKNDKKHVYFAGIDCPWCHLIATARVVVFTPGQLAKINLIRIDDLRTLIQKLENIRFEYTLYIRPKPVHPISVNLPPNLWSVRKPNLLKHPTAPVPLPKPDLLPAPAPPRPVPRPALHPLPTPPSIPNPPETQPYPPLPEKLPYPQLQDKPPHPGYPPVPALPPPDLFVEQIFLVASGICALMCIIALELGVLLTSIFILLCIFMKATAGIRRTTAERALKREHQAECRLVDEEYQLETLPIEISNRKILDSWNRANEAKEQEYQALCKAIDGENECILAPWKEKRLALMLEHQQKADEIEGKNRQLLEEWEIQKASIRATYERECKQIEMENERRILRWKSLSESQQSDYRRKCDEIDRQNQLLIAKWEAENEPWIRERKRWQERISSGESEIVRLEAALEADRQSTLLHFQAQKSKGLELAKSCNSVMQDYDREIRKSELNSRQIQVDNHLEKSLIRMARIKGITEARIISLESFGITSAKDVEKLSYLKVPGIGKVLTDRLFDWRDRLITRFRPKHGLPESEKQRIAARYSPLLLPVFQSIQKTIDELKKINHNYRIKEAIQMESITRVVQDLAVAEATFKHMNEI